MDRLKIDTDAHNLRHSVTTIIHLLDDFIPTACRRYAELRLTEAFHKDGVELTSKLMRKQYEAWKEFQLDKMEMFNPVLKVPEK